MNQLVLTGDPRGVDDAHRRPGRTFGALPGPPEDLGDRRSRERSIDQLKEVGVQRLAPSGGPCLELATRLVGYTSDLQQRSHTCMLAQYTYKPYEGGSQGDLSLIAVRRVEQRRNRE